MGSSRVYRHIEPSVVDSITGMACLNMGVPSTFNPEAYYITERLLQELPASSPIKHIVLEMQPVTPIGFVNVLTVRNSYWMNWEYIAFAFRHYTSKSYLKSVPYVSLYATSYAHKYFSLEKYVVAKNFKEEITPRWLGMNQDGFYSLDDDSLYDKSLLVRRKELLADTMPLQDRVQKTLKPISESDQRKFFSQPQVDKIMELARLAHSKGVQLTLLIMPKLKEYREIQSIKPHLSALPIIDMSDPNKYPEFYQLQYSFDIGHLNEAGARLFSLALAEELKKLQQGKH
jgi:hypothetical protein